MAWQEDGSRSFYAAYANMVYSMAFVDADLPEMGAIVGHGVSKPNHLGWRSLLSYRRGARRHQCDSPLWVVMKARCRAHGAIAP